MVYDEYSKLARRVQRGDRKAFEQILDKFERPIFSFIYNFFQNTSTCEDLTQETFLRAYRFIGTFRPKEKLSTWLFSIARNLCIDELRRMQKGSTVSIDDVDPEVFATDGSNPGNPAHAAMMAQESEIVRNLIARLPEKYRTSLVLFYFNDMSYEEISAVMKTSLSNTKIILFRGKKMLLNLYMKESRGGGVTSP